MAPSITGHIASEDGSVEQPALELLAELGWQRINLQAEQPGPENPTGRTSFRQTYLPTRLRAALAKLNPNLTTEALKLAEERLVEDRSAMLPMAANRALLASRACSQALMRAQDVAALLREICTVVVETGGYRMAWVGFAVHDDAQTVRPMAQAGFDQGYLSTVRVSWGDNANGKGPTGTAIREHRPVASRHLPADAAYGPWRDETRQRGYAASIALPLMLGPQECIGALNIYASDPAAFDEEETHLVMEMADDLAFGIRSLRDRTARSESEPAKRPSTPIA